MSALGRERQTPQRLFQVAYLCLSLLQLLHECRIVVRCGGDGTVEAVALHRRRLRHRINLCLQLLRKLRKRFPLCHGVLQLLGQIVPLSFCVLRTNGQLSTSISIKSRITDAPGNIGTLESLSACQIVPLLAVTRNQPLGPCGASPLQR